jgi:RNase P subunit RPR2
MPEMKPPFGPEQFRRRRLYAQGKVDQKQAIEAIGRKWTARRACPICEVVDWGVGDDLLRIWNSQHRPVYPCIAVTCQNCGHTIFFNAAALNLLPEGEK